MRAGNVADTPDGPRTLRSRNLTCRKRNVPPSLSVSALTARALTCAATDATPARASALLMNITLEAQLSRDVEWAKRVYAYIASGLGRDIYLPDLEQRFQFKFAPEKVDDTLRDPYSSRDMKRDVETSFGELLRGLERVCSILSGIDANDTRNDAQQEVDAAMNLMWNRLVLLLTDSRATHESLVDAATEAFSEVAVGALARARRRFERQRVGVQALQNLCAAAAQGRSVDDVLEDRGDVLFEILHTPPANFLDKLRHANVPIDEIRSFLRPFGDYVPICGAAKSLSISRWCTKYAAAVDFVCVATLQDLRCASHLDEMDVAWHGVSVVTATAGCVRSCVLPCPRVTHTHGCDDVIVVSVRSTQCTALRSVRFARAVCELVAQRRITPRCVRAECLLAPMSRYESEASVQLQQLRSRLAEEEMVEEGEKDDDEYEKGCSSESDQCESPVGASVVRAPTPHAVCLEDSVGNTVFGALRVADSVNHAMRRDYVIFVILHALVQNATMSKLHLSTCTVVSKIETMQAGGEAAATLRASSRASLQQTVSYVMAKVVRVASEWSPSNDMPCAECDLAYGKLPTWVRGTKGVSATEKGLVVFERFLMHAIQATQVDGAQFATTWFSSRSAKCHARRKQQQR